MDYERMWNELKSEIQIQENLSENISILKLLNRITDIENAEIEAEKRYKSGELPF